MKISKSWITGAITVDYACPGCRHPLFSKVEDIGKPDKCPHCGRAFIVPGKKLYAEFMASEKEKRGLQAAAKQKKEEEAAAVAKAIETEQEQREAKLAAEVVFDEAEEFDAGLTDTFQNFGSTPIPNPHEYPAIRLISVVYSVCAVIAAIVGALGACGGVIGAIGLAARNEHRGAWIAAGGAGVCAIVGLLAWATLKMVPELLAAFLRIERNTQITAAMIARERETK